MVMIGLHRGQALLHVENMISHHAMQAGWRRQRAGSPLTSERGVIALRCSSSLWAGCQHAAGGRAGRNTGGGGLPRGSAGGKPPTSHDIDAATSSAQHLLARGDKRACGSRDGASHPQPKAATQAARQGCRQASAWKPCQLAGARLLDLAAAAAAAASRLSASRLSSHPHLPTMPSVYAEPPSLAVLPTSDESEELLRIRHSVSTRLLPPETMLPPTGRTETMHGLAHTQQPATSATP